ncbi:RidA family protein [Nocardioides sp. CCNWLW239]|uniref:RidA family protein n=1 Tax=Nocardioides sp. CCNWLW239 TaxID=3128902 RepID=UPI00301672AF
MSIRRIRTIAELGEPVGAFSQAVVANGFVFTSGQIPATSAGPVEGDFETRLLATLDNLRTLLEASGSGFDRIVKINGYLTDPDHLDTYNRVFNRVFGTAALPARTTVGVTLWGVELEIDCVALVSEDDA